MVLQQTEFKNHLLKKAEFGKQALLSDADHTTPTLSIKEISIHSNCSFLPQCVPTLFKQVEQNIENTLERCLPQAKGNHCY
jgi:hypothetical protein